MGVVDAARISLEEWKYVNDSAQPEARPARSFIVIAEDNADSRDALQALLDAHGYEVRVATDGREAVQRAHEARPDLVLMDIMMPGMDGLEATRVLRGEEAFDRVPIVALTAMEGGRERALEAGCDDYINKPIDVTVFFRKVRWWIDHGRGARGGTDTA